MLIKNIIEEQNDNKSIFGVTLENESCELRFPYISENRETVETLLSSIPDDISEAHIKDIIKDFIMGKAYDKLIKNDLA